MGKLPSHLQTSNDKVSIIAIICGHRRVRDHMNYAPGLERAVLDLPPAFTHRIISPPSILKKTPILFTFA